MNKDNLLTNPVTPLERLHGVHEALKSLVAPWIGVRADIIPKEVQRAVVLVNDMASILPELESSLTASEKRVQELEPGAECWAALCACARIKLIGAAGLDNDSPQFNTPFAHIGLEFWTQHEAKGDAQDLNGRDWFCRFMTKAVDVYRATGAKP